MMESYFKCYRCNNYKTDRKSNIRTHLLKKNKCNKHPDVEGFTDIEIYNKSMIRINEISNDILLKNKIDICIKCNKVFSTKYYLSRHFLKCKNLLDPDNN